jgi:hypothetical protein
MEPQARPPQQRTRRRHSSSPHPSVFSQTGQLSVSCQTGRAAQVSTSITRPATCRVQGHCGTLAATSSTLRSQSSASIQRVLSLSGSASRLSRAKWASGGLDWHREASACRVMGCCLPVALASLSGMATRGVQGIPLDADTTGWKFESLFLWHFSSPCLLAPLTACALSQQQSRRVLHNQRVPDAFPSLPKKGLRSRGAQSSSYSLSLVPSRHRPPQLQWKLQVRAPVI